MDKYKCYDCEKELENLHFEESFKEKCIRDMEGNILVICNDCKDNEDY